MKFYLLVITYLISHALQASNFYVATDGLDSNVGAITAPFLTIQHGSNQLNAGDTLFIRAGSYFEKLFLNTQGSSTSPIVISNYNSEQVIVDGTNVTGNEMLVISSKSNVHVQGLIFQNNYVQGAKGIYILSEGSNIVISNCEVRNIGWTTDPNADPYSATPTGQAHGILVNGRTTVGIQNLEISDCNIHDIVSGNSEALTLVGNVSNFQILRDSVYDTKNIGIVVAGHYSWAVDGGVDPLLNQARDGSILECVTYNNRRFSNVDAPAGIYADGAKNVLISRNTSYNNGNGMSIGCENSGFSASNISATNNVVYANDNQGVYFGSNAASLENSILKNNTIVENGTLGNFYSEVSLQNSTNCDIVQNILIPTSASHYAVSIFGYTVSNLRVDNNLAYRYDGNTVNLYVEDTPSQYTPTNSLTANPQFVDSLLLNPDFDLRSTSPAINQGLFIHSIIDSQDRYSNPRVVNGKLDHGAIESQDGGCQDILTIDDSCILSGIFVAKQEIILENLSGISINDIRISAPQLTVENMFTVNHSMLIDSLGCN